MHSQISDVTKILSQNSQVADLFTCKLKPIFDPILFLRRYMFIYIKKSPGSKKKDALYYIFL